MSTLQFQGTMADAARNIWRLGSIVDLNPDHFAKIDKKLLDLFVANYGASIFMTWLMYTDRFLEGYIWISSKEFVRKGGFKSIRVDEGVTSYDYHNNTIVDNPGHSPIFVTIEEVVAKLALDADSTSNKAILKIYHDYRKSIENAENR